MRAREKRENEAGANTDARQVRSRKALNRALLELLEEKSFDQLTVREISARAGTGYATFFRHYPGKEALLADVAADEIAMLLKLVIPIFIDGNRHGSAVVLGNFINAHRKLWSALLTGGAASVLRYEFIRQAREHPATTGRSTAGIWLPADLVTAYGTGSTIDLLAWWLEHDEAFTPEELANIIDRLIVTPLFGEQ